MADPYLDGTCAWWHLARPSAELLAAQADGWLGRPGVVVDLGCGLGTEIGYLAGAGWAAVGIDLSAAALRGAAAAHPGAGLAQADALRLPFRDGAADLLLDRGCFHYLHPADRDGYAREARRVLRPGGRFLLRACRTAGGVPTGLDAASIERVFSGWRIEAITAQDIASDTRSMPALVARMAA